MFQDFGTAHVYAWNTLRMGDNLRLANCSITWAVNDGRQELLMLTFMGQCHVGGIVILINKQLWQLHTVHKTTSLQERHRKEQLSILLWLIIRHLWPWSIVRSRDFGKYLTFASISTWDFVVFFSQYGHLHFLCSMCSKFATPSPICFTLQWKISHTCFPTEKCPHHGYLLFLSRYSLLYWFFNLIFFLIVTIQSFLSNQEA